MTLQLKDFRIRNRPVVSGRQLDPDMSEQMRTNLSNAEAQIAEPFKGLTTDGQVVPGLYSLQQTGLSTESMKQAADAWLASLDAGQREAARFDMDSDAWRRWSNIHVFLMRHGAMLEPMSQEQRDLAFGVLREGFSPEGFQLARNIMKLNESIREITGSDEELGEWLYWLSIMGEPSPDQPWGWQMDGHHLNVNCFVLGDQVVMTPMFMGSEPVAVDVGKHAGIRAFRAEESAGLALARTLSAEQRSKAIIGEDVPPGVFTGAFRDNFEMSYEGVKFDDLTSHQQALMFDLIGAYVNRMRSDHARLRMGRNPAAPERDPLCLDGRHGRGQRLLLPRPQPGGADRVRPPGRHFPGQRRGFQEPHPHGDADAQRQRLRQGPASPAPGAGPSPPRVGGRAIAS